MLNFFIGFALFEAGAIFGFFVATLLNAAHVGQESTIFEENDNGRYTGMGQCLASLERQLCHNCKNKTLIDPAAWGKSVGDKNE